LIDLKKAKVENLCINNMELEAETEGDIDYLGLPYIRIRIF